jgi:hypothetical protein
LARGGVPAEIQDAVTSKRTARYVIARHADDTFHRHELRHVLPTAGLDRYLTFLYASYEPITGILCPHNVCPSGRRCP